MGLIERDFIINQISPPFDNFLATQLVDEFISMERRFIQRDWEPAELDGGQFCEIASRILYHIDSGNLNRDRDFNDCLRYIEDENNRNLHALVPRHDGRHLSKVLRVVYKFRSQRGAVHISPTYTPNHMDSKLLIECVRWTMNELLRIFWQGDREKVAKAIRELLQFDVPCIGAFGDELLVQRTDLTAEEELLILLHYAGESGFSRRELGQYTQFAPSSISNALKKLMSPEYRQVIILSNNRYRLTDLGSKRIREHLAGKLLLS